MTFPHKPEEGSAEGPVTYRRAKQLLSQQLAASGIEDADHDAFVLLSHICGMDRTRYLLRQGEIMTPEEQRLYFDAGRKRASRIPLQHIMGYTDFMGFSFHVNEQVLIPRQETQLLAAEAVEAVNNMQLPHPAVLDLCTGSGILAVSIGRLCPQAQIIAADISPGALAVARENAADLQVPVTFLQGDLFEPVTGKFDLIISNPPYIPTAVIDTLSDEVRLHDPKNALDGGKDGLDFYRRIAAEAGEHLKEDGILLMEIGADQAEALRKLLTDKGYRDIYVLQDLAGRDRVVGCRRF